MNALVSLKAYAGKKICVACSGGADSVALLHAFHTQAEELKITLSAVTCEHGIRGKQSLSDLAFVQSLCEKWGIPLIVFRADIPARARESKCGLEEEGRKFRYECFASIIESGEADFVATAHHRDDLAETVLFRLARGTSLSGLNAIRERNGIIRPLLNVSRETIEQYAREHKLAYREDGSNRDERYMRNKLRHTVLPALERVVNGAGAHLAQFACKAEEDDAYLQSLALQNITVCGEEVSFPVDLPMPLFARACTIAFRKLNLESYTAKNIEEIASLKSSQSGRRVCFHGVEAVKEGDGIVLFRPQEKFSGEIGFAEGTFDIGEWRVQIACGEGALYADADCFPAGCVLRTRREGDLFTPYGGKEKPLKKFLTDRKVPARRSATLPLVAKGNTVYAVFGVEISDLVKVTDGTKRRIYFSIENKPCY